MCALLAGLCACPSVHAHLFSCVSVMSCCLQREHAMTCSIELHEVFSMTWKYQILCSALSLHLTSLQGCWALLIQAVVTLGPDRTGAAILQVLRLPYGHHLLEAAPGRIQACRSAALGEPCGMQPFISFSVPCVTLRSSKNADPV